MRRIRISHLLPPLFAFCVLAGDTAPELLEGRAASAVRVFIYEDLECPDCSEFETVLEEKILPRYGDRVAFVHRDFPLPYETWAPRAALISRVLASRDLALALAYRRYVLSHQTQITAENFGGHIASFARQHRLDANDIESRAQAPEYGLVLKSDREDAIAHGVTHTPTVLVGNRRFVETIDAAELARAINDALASRSGKQN
jgi:protein-disulfide isomerase